MRQDLHDIADQIAAEWRDGTGCHGLAKKYKCGFIAIQRVILSVVPFDEYIRTTNRRERANRVGLGDLLRQPLGTIRIHKKLMRGKVYHHRVIKCSMGRGKHKDWKRLSVYNWERANGPIPKGYVVAHIDGDLMNDDISNLCILTKRELVLQITKTTKWSQAMAVARSRMSASDRSMRAKKAAKTLSRKNKEARMLREDRDRMARIREIIPVPSCVKERMRSGWWDNREDDDDSEV